MTPFLLQYQAGTRRLDCNHPIRKHPRVSRLVGLFNSSLNFKGDPPLFVIQPVTLLLSQKKS